MKEGLNTRLYGFFEDVYEALNRHLFDGKLPPVVFLVVRDSSMEMAFRDRFFQDENGEQISVIEINDEVMFRCSFRHFVADMVHEMVHCEQRSYGVVFQGDWEGHDEEFVNRMRELGVNESATWLRDYYVKSGKLEHVFNEHVSKIKDVRFSRSNEKLYCDDFGEKELRLYWKNEGKLIASKKGNYFGIEMGYMYLDKKGKQRVTKKYMDIDEIYKAWYREYVEAMIGVEESVRYEQKTVRANFKGIVEAFRSAYGKDYKVRLLTMKRDVKRCEGEEIDDAVYERIWNETCRFIVDYGNTKSERKGVNNVVRERKKMGAKR